MKHLIQRRLAQHQLSQQHFSDPHSLVSWFGAMQGQDYSAVKWAVGLRLPQTTDAEIEAALDARVIVRSWLMRGTLHLVAAEDLRWMLAVVAPRLIASSTRRLRELNLDEATLQRAKALLQKALADGQPHSRDVLFAMLDAAGINPRQQRGYHILQQAALDGLLCQTSAPRNTPNFVSLESVAPESAPLPQEEALAALAWRYFRSHGPATLQDFAWWGWLRMAEARAGLAAIQARLSSFSSDDQAYWFVEADPPPPPPGPQLALLPGFDEYYLGYQERRRVIEEQYMQRVLPGKNGIFKPTLVLDGEVRGLWKRSFKKDSVIVSAEPFSPLEPAAQAAFARAAQGYAAYLQRALILED